MRAGLILSLCLTTAAQAATPIVLPPGPAKATIEAKCKQCHDLKNIVKQHQDAKWWATTIDKMIERGLDIEPEDQAQVIKYLSKNFGPKTGAPKKSAH